MTKLWKTATLFTRTRSLKQNTVSKEPENQVLVMIPVWLWKVLTGDREFIPRDMLVTTILQKIWRKS